MTWRYAMKTNKRMYKFRIYVMAVVSILVLMMAVIIVFVDHTLIDVSNLLLIRIIMVFAILLFVAGLVLMLKFIYLPISNIQKVIDKLDFWTPQTENVLKREGKIHPFALDIAEMMKKMKESLDREYSLNILKKQAELTSLQSQINPHFLYNTLDSIRGQVITEGLTEAGDMVEALSLLFRYSINHSNDLVTFEQELENVGNYIKIIQYRLDNRFDVNKKIDETDNMIMGYYLPRLTLQPLIENAINHGLASKRGKGNIVIRAQTTQKRFIISIEDDGVGIDNEKLDALNQRLKKVGKTETPTVSNGSGIAIFNVNDRIKMIFGDEFGIHVNSSKGLGTEVYISLPIKSTSREIKDEK